METIYYRTRTQGKTAEKEKISNEAKMSRQAVLVYSIISTCALTGAALYCYFTAYWDAALMLAVPSIAVPLFAVRLYHSFK
jgi:hypothetical protein